jgi:hypothetical protein
VIGTGNPDPVTGNCRSLIWVQTGADRYLIRLHLHRDGGLRFSPARNWLSCGPHRPPSQFLGLGCRVSAWAAAVPDLEHIRARYRTKLNLPAAIGDRCADPSRWSAPLFQHAEFPPHPAEIVRRCSLPVSTAALAVLKILEPADYLSDAPPQCEPPRAAGGYRGRAAVRQLPCGNGDQEAPS